MEFSELVLYFQKLDSISARLEMTDIVKTMLLNSYSDLPQVLLFTTGRVFPPYDRRDVGLAQKTMMKCIAKASGYTEKQVEKEVASTGDTGIACEKLFEKKKQTTLFSKKISIKQIYFQIEKISEMGGKGSNERKINHTVELLNSCSPSEAKYLIRLMLGEMRLGVGEGIIRDSIAGAYEVGPALVERAINFLNDYGEVAEIAREKGNDGLKQVSVKVFRPIKPMLAPISHGFEEVLERFSPLEIEKKYDGARAQIHFNGKEFRIFTRRLDDITKQFPDVVNALKSSLKAKNCIIEGEILAMKDGKPMPFQLLSRRIKRKYEIKEMVEKIPVQIHLFDCIYANNELAVKSSFKNRRKLLESIVTENSEVKLADRIVTKDLKVATDFYKNALAEGHEGVMIKNLESEYKAGSRVGSWYKLKPETETLDLVIVGAEWGEGRRTKWLGSFLVACRDPDTNEFLEIGRMATGLNDEQLQYLTDLLKRDFLEEIGKEVKLRPRVVVEVGYQEIQKSPTYASGYAMRFPRLVRIREDRAPEECDSLERVLDLIK